MNEQSAPWKADLFSQAEQGLEVTTRDDQGEFSLLLDAAKASRRSGGRFRLVDSGKFSVFELEWLAEAGADIYTSDEARANRAELDLLARARARGNAVIAYFHRGVLTDGPAEAPSSWEFLKGVGRSGVDIHLSNRDAPRDLSPLAEAAAVCRRAGARLVYYHHGRPGPGLETLAREGAWIHLSDRTPEGSVEATLLSDVIRQAAASGSGVVLHLERGLPVEILADFLREGAFLLFMTPPSGRGSRLETVERKARKRKLDRRSYYLHTVFLP